mmetsp:Transcript_33348/g.44006  ORF Transcript_33348/g.44006 Transcript_33348/m.44006 type:complete len:211 (+) Transcript_33348:50-682(+)
MGRVSIPFAFLLFCFQIVCIFSKFHIPVIWRLFKPESEELLFFTGDNCEHCEDMKEKVKEVEKIIGEKVTEVDVWLGNRGYNMMAYINLDEAEEEDEKKEEEKKFNVLPFFYNARSGERIVGACSFENLLKWADGEECQMFEEDPDQEIEEVQGGAMGGEKAPEEDSFQAKLDAMKKSGKAKVKETTDKKGVSSSAWIKTPQRFTLSGRK